MSQSQTEAEYTTLSIRESVRDRLQDLKPYDSVTYSDLIDDMADSWVNERGDSRD